MKLIMPSAALLCILLAGCVKDPPPDDIVSAYFEKVSEGDFFALREYLTPDGQEVLDEFSSMESVRVELEKARPEQKKFWSDISRSVSAPKYTSGERAEVDFTAICNGTSVKFIVVLHRINGAWKISSHSFIGPRMIQFKKEVMNAKNKETLSGAKKETDGGTSASVASPVPEVSEK